MPNYFSIQIKNVTKGKTDAEKKKLKRNKKKTKTKKQTVAIFQWLQSTGLSLKKRASDALRAQAAQTHPC